MLGLSMQIELERHEARIPCKGIALGSEDSSLDLRWMSTFEETAIVYEERECGWANLDLRDETNPESITFRYG
jgi:hypothetical protein